MKLDVRFPIGLMFCIFGLILAGYGLATRGSELYRRSLDININLLWGLALLAFGAFMLLLTWRAARCASARKKAEDSPSKA
jgi:hypothetical protein